MDRTELIAEKLKELVLFRRDVTEKCLESPSKDPFVLMEGLYNRVSGLHSSNWIESPDFGLVILELADIASYCVFIVQTFEEPV